MKKIPKHPECPFLFEMDTRERDAMDWLFKTLSKIEKNPSSKNRMKAKYAADLIAKMAGHVVEMHDLAHELEARVFELANEVTMEDYLVRMSKKTSKEGLN